MKVKVSRNVPRGQVYHGKSVADGIGGLVKNLVAQKVLMEPDVVMSNVREIKENIQTNCEISLHDKDDIKQVQKLLPKKIGQLPGATKIHELVFEIDGRILKKNFLMKIRTSRFSSS